MTVSEHKRGLVVAWRESWIQREKELFIVLEDDAEVRYYRTRNKSKSTTDIGFPHTGTSTTNDVTDVTPQKMGGEG